MNEQIVETLEREAAGNATRYSRGQSATIEDVTVLARWHDDFRRKTSGYWDFTYIVDVAPVGRADAVNADAYMERSRSLAAECTRINKERNG